MRRFHKIMLFIMLASAIFQVLQLTQWEYKPIYLIRPANVTSENHVILLWTAWFGRPNWTSTAYENIGCEYSNCRLTMDRRLLQSASAVLFHALDLDLNDLPSYRYINQRWVIFSSESPHSLKRMARELTAIEKHIDWTMTYRLDSDVPVPYGTIVKRNTSLSDYSVNYKSKTKDVIWLASNCRTAANRELFVEELMQYIDVDIYGKCGSHECQPKGSLECYRRFESSYKFLLAFENSICKDYVTEKMYRALQYDIVPVVFGGANYKKLFPENSFIDALSFDSPKQLAEALHRISSNETMYQVYYQWKRHYIAKSNSWEAFCILCEKLNGNEFDYLNQQRSKPGFLKWFFDGSNCTSWINYSSWSYLKGWLEIRWNSILSR